MKSFFRKIALVLAFAMVFTAMPMGVFAEDNPCANGHQYNPNYYWSTEEQAHRHACDRCGYADVEDPHADADADGRCDVCEVGVVNDGNNNYVHTHKFTVVNKDNVSHWFSCEDIKCMQTNDWQSHADPDGDGFCGCGYEICTHPEPRKDSEGNIEYAVGPMGHNVFCAVCGEQYGGEKHIPGEEYTPVWGENGEELGHALVCTVCRAPAGEPLPHKTSNHYGPVWENGSEISTEHSLLCDDCGAAVGATEAHVPSGEWGSDGEYHFELCDLCGYNIESTKALHTAGDEWVMLDETSHVAVCAVCRADMDSIKENHTAPNADGNCSKCYAPVDANGAHKHEIINEWFVEGSQHIKHCNTCGRVVEMDSHSDANGDKKCDVCNASVEAITEDGEHIDYVHEHVKSDEWSIDINGHNQKCAGCNAYPFGEEHTDENGDRACDVCGAVYVVKIDAPSDNDYYTITNKIDESYIMGLPENERPAFFEALGAILEVAGDNAFNIFEITCKDKTTGDLVSEPDTTFTFTITLPTGIIEAPQGSTIQWVMYRYHNGVVEKLPIRDNGNGTGSFESDKFSYYVLGFEFVSTTHNHIWGYNTQYDAAAHWDYCHLCGEKGAVVPHSYKDGICICGWSVKTTNRTNPATGVTAEMLGE